MPENLVLLCQSLPNKKRLFVAKTPKFYVDGVTIPQVQPKEAFKYLGHHHGALGFTNTDISELRLYLEKVAKTALKPLQKVTITKQYIIPKCRFKLSALAIYKTTLSSVDKLIRQSVKQILCLPHSTSNGFLYAGLRDGGLEIPNLTDAITTSLLTRTHNIYLGQDCSARRALASPWAISNLQPLANIAKHGMSK